MLWRKVMEYSPDHLPHLWWGKLGSFYFALVPFALCSLFTGCRGGRRWLSALSLLGAAVDGAMDGEADDGSCSILPAPTVDGTVDGGGRRLLLNPASSNGGRRWTAVGGGPCSILPALTVDGTVDGGGRRWTAAPAQSCQLQRWTARWTAVDGASRKPSRFYIAPKIVSDSIC